MKKQYCNPQIEVLIVVTADMMHEQGVSTKQPGGSPEEHLAPTRLYC